MECDSYLYNLALHPPLSIPMDPFDVSLFHCKYFQKYERIYISN